ncbi:MAG: hypothetical protein ACYC96_01580 [Fimbriimonadaceae bacterium]
MLTFLPALILLLLHGPANLDGRLARAGERADVGAQLPSADCAATRANRAYLAELLRKFPGATVLACLAEEPANVQAVAPLGRTPLIAQHQDAFCPAPVGANHRDRDGPRPA